MNHRIHPVTQVCEVCGAMAGAVENGDEPRACTPKEEGWYWIREDEFHNWRPGKWHDDPPRWEAWGSYDIWKPEQVAAIGPRIHPPS